jgi:enamine deaminase RidA (YjgF/YER057c/UK114 family)
MSAPITRLETSARFSEAVVHNGVVYLAGQVPTADALGDARTQTRSVLSEIDRCLALAGTDKSRLLSATVYLTNIANIADMNAEWEAWLPAGAGPARATVGNVTLAKPEWLVEISITAAL